VFKFKYTLVALLGFVSSVTQAGEAAELNFIGFSEDGTHLAFEQYGTMDGSGSHFSYTYVIDVAKNKYAIKPILREDVDGEKTLEEFRAEPPEELTAQLTENGIQTGNFGQHVVTHLFSDVGADPKLAQFALFPPLAPLNHSTYSVQLTEEEGEAECFGLGEPKRFSLKVIHDDTQSETVLQTDSKIPKTRGCPLAYRIQDVYVYNRQYIVVFLNMITPGFEGQSMRYLVVTGALPEPKDTSEEVKG